MNISELYYLQAEFCKVISHPVRLVIIETIGTKPKTVGEISKIVNTSPSSVSQHLKKLLEKGVVVRKKEGNKVYYHLKYPDIIKASQIMRNVLQRILKERVEILENKNIHDSAAY